MVFDMFSDPEARLFYPQMDNSQNCRRWIQWNQDNYATHGFGLWVIEDLDSGDFLGDCGLTYQDVDGHRLMELGYHLRVTYRGDGLATEAARTAIDFGFEHLGSHLVCSIVHPANQASIRLAKRIHTLNRTFVDATGEQRLLFWSENDSG